MSENHGVSAFFQRLVGRAEPDQFRTFLPAALEVLETPPSPTGRALGLIIILFFLVALTWSFFGRVDIMATAPGRLVPLGDTKVIQPVEIGVVRAIHVQDGQRVRAGDLLVELDPTQTNADQNRVGEDLIHAKLDVARLTALKIAVETGSAPRFIPPADAPATLSSEASAATKAQWAQQVAKIGDLSQQISKEQAEGAEVDAQLSKINASIPLLAEKEKIHRDLTAQGYGTSLTYLDAQQQASDARHDVDVQHQRLMQTKAARAALERQRDETKAQFSADLLSDLRKAEETAGELSQDLVKAGSKSDERALRSPIDGVVDQLAVHTLGGVVTPAQHLMIVVPDGQNLLIEAQLANRDVGFVHAGQIAKVKVETFNFTRYGLVDGKVINVSRDVIDPLERPLGAPPPTPASQAPPPAYVARILLSKSSMRIDGNNEPLQPGMAVTAEIRTGTRTVLDYLLSPIARRAQDSLHER